MEIAYLMVGKRFQAKDVADLNRQLAKHNLVFNPDLGIKRLTEPPITISYDLVPTVGDSTDSEGYDVIVGKIIGTNGYGQLDIVEKELSELEITLNEVREDIPDAKIIAGSYWS